MSKIDDLLSHLKMRLAQLYSGDYMACGVLKEELYIDMLQSIKEYEDGTTNNG